MTDVWRGKTGIPNATEIETSAQEAKNTVWLTTHEEVEEDRTVLILPKEDAISLANWVLDNTDDLSGSIAIDRHNAIATYQGGTNQND